MRGAATADDAANILLYQFQAGRSNTRIVIVLVVEVVVIVVAVVVVAVVVVVVVLVVVTHTEIYTYVLSRVSSGFPPVLVNGVWWTGAKERERERVSERKREREKESEYVYVYIYISSKNKLRSTTPDDDSRPERDLGRNAWADCVRHRTHKQ